MNIPKTGDDTIPRMTPKAKNTRKKKPDWRRIAGLGVAAVYLIAWGAAVVSLRKKAA